MTLDEGQPGIGTLGKDVPNIILDKEDVMGSTDLAEFLCLHHLLGHILMNKMQDMACQGLLPSKFTTCKKPMCTVCLYGKATKKPWRVKGKQSHVHLLTTPEKCVSVDQLILPTPRYFNPSQRYANTGKISSAHSICGPFFRCQFCSSAVRYIC